MAKEDDLKRDYPKYPNQELSFVVPICPSVNHMYIQSKSGKKILTKEAKQYIATVQQEVRKEMKEQGWKKDNENVWYVMELYIYMPDRRIRDSHNMFKLLLDCCEGLLYNNDYFVMVRTQEVELDKDNPRIEVIFYPKEGRRW